MTAEKKLIFVIIRFFLNIQLHTTSYMSSASQLHCVHLSLQRRWTVNHQRVSAESVCRECLQRRWTVNQRVSAESVCRE